MLFSPEGSTPVKSFLNIGAFVLRVLGFFFILFFFERLLFVAFYFPEIWSEAGFHETLRAFYMPFRLDLSAAAYFTVIPFLLSLAFLFVGHQRARTVLTKVITVLILLFAALTILIHVGETVTYQEWKSKLSSRVFVHLAHPTEMVRTATPAYMVEFALMVLVLGLVVWLLYRKLLKRAVPVAAPGSWFRRFAIGLPALLFYAFLLIVAIRGGLGRYPLGISNGYFSNYHIVNDASVNTIWNFGDKWLRYRKGNLDQFFGKYPQEKAEDITRMLLSDHDSLTTKVVKKDTFNIVFIVLESWSAQMVEALGGVGAPSVSKVAGEGILFERVYAASWTSQKGNASIFSGYPALPRSPINQQDEKIRSLPSFPRSLGEYNSEYHYGGDLDFGNIGGYLVNAGFNKLFDEDSLSTLQPRGRLGAHDEATLPYFHDQLERAGKGDKPFFCSLFTLSSHSPYDIPGLTDWPTGGEWAAYAATIAYADEHLGKFFEKVRRSPIHDKTLFVLIADHGRTNEYNPFPYNDKMYHIPMIWWGGVIKEEFRGAKVDKIGSQYDLAKTLLNQMDREVSGYRFSKDLLNEGSGGFAMYEHHNGYGWVDANGYFAFDFDRNKVVESEFTDESAFADAYENSRAFITAVYRDFLF
ncbi:MULTISPECIES: LTA synthase family protein [unclassified Imperialibacter]|uniref:LTA synthase family protein n=1 Tax=unclassified Imperialibacter TaxID=2629706 RepID=UPI001253D37B|nr:MULTISPECIES: LTA synthase family protein [unclassified Imperialibacter]CAD5269885.1 conserved membrane hypothetical protein [Imperialibacter sp. 89]CAD5297874.1 conserved membrane hypothetical protein [Imperialibacter sp. 75]VVT34226.1 conserved membrane hypothetical protein [Imperialibacter sp. EC-SDR9]